MELPTSAGYKNPLAGRCCGLPALLSLATDSAGRFVLFFLGQKQMDSLAYRLGPGHSVGLAIFL